MSLMETVRKDLTASMKERNAVRTQSLRLLMSELQKEATSGKPADDLAVLRRVISRGEEAEAAFRQGGATDRADNEAAQVTVYKTYLPVQLSDDELEALVKEAIAESGAASPKQMGLVMKVAVPRVAGRADSARVSAAVKRLLENAS